ncbi:hypothetical protein DL96DRAFT_1716893 [Flagelloscypha sp. PMI_526]|nr:hypothetical protein DL96DRAFT_1716893 [Flagelloscypha sp. PMI_526]
MAQDPSRGRAWDDPTEAYRRQLQQNAGPPRPTTAGPEGSNRRRRSSSRPQTPNLQQADFQDPRQWQYSAMATPPPPYEAPRSSSSHSHQRSHSRSRSQQVVDTNAPPVPFLPPRTGNRQQPFIPQTPYAIANQEHFERLHRLPPPPPIISPRHAQKIPDVRPEEIYVEDGPEFQPGYMRSPQPDHASPQKPFFKRLFGGIVGSSTKDGRTSGSGPQPPVAPAAPSSSSFEQRRARTKSF